VRVTLEFAEPALSGGASRLIDPAFRAHYFTILRLCMRQLGDRSDAEDAAQETFRRALQQREGMIGDPLPWLIAVARNVCIDELRRRRTGRNALERSAAEGSGVHGEGDGSNANPERVVVGRMFVRELLDRLTPAERRVVAGSLIEGRSGGELAASLGVTASTARVLLARARGKLRRYLEDGQGLVTGVCFAGWRTAHWVRQRVLSRPWALQPRVELLLPALVVTAMVSASGAPAAANGGAAGDAADHYVATAHRVDLSADAVIGRNAEPSSAALVAPAESGAHRAPAQPSRTGGSPLDVLLPAPDPTKAWVTDFEPSPNYSSDHTVYMVGRGSCELGCNQLFRSTDGGATWTYVPTRGLQGSQLLLPSTGYGAGRFYAAGTFLQLTTDGGAHFQNAEPVAGVATVAPPWLGAQVVTSDVALSLIDGSAVPHPVAVFGSGETAAGAPVLLPSLTGFTAFQLVQGIGGGPDLLLRCSSSGCAEAAQLPFAGNAQTFASPNFDTDHTLVVIGTGGVAVSHDGGATFALVSTETMLQAIAVSSPRGARLVAVDAAHARNTDDTLVYSDDWGQTWHPAALHGAAQGSPDIHTLGVVAAGRLIASAVDPSRTVLHLFICSDDGTSWSVCMPEKS
jgi:RNA polymerase sigma-70 factor (ECF subfamily)